MPTRENKCERAFSLNDEITGGVIFFFLLSEHVFRTQVLKGVAIPKLN